MQSAGFVDELKDSSGILFQKVDQVLVIVKLQSIEVIFQILANKKQLFGLKYIGNIELLKHFIGKIDAKLFERVFLEDFKAKNVENIDEITVSGQGIGEVFSLNTQNLVDLQDQPVKELFIKTFG